MSKFTIVNNLSRNLHKVGFKLQKHSPEIMVGAGIVGVVASTILACKATTKLSGILEEGKGKSEQIHKYVDENGYSEEYTEQDMNKDITIVHTQTAVQVVKTYAPAVILGVASIACIVGSHRILTKRNAAITAAYATIDRSFKDYRKRVVDRFGKELDRELKYNIKSEEIDETVVDDKGKEKKVKKTVNTVNPNDISDYARFFDEHCTNWCKDAEYNLVFLKQQQNYANDLLKSRGFVFLNEVYDMIGTPRSKAGQIVGWVYDENNPVGDNYIDFGIYTDSEAGHLFVKGVERSILLDFNVDGNVLDILK